MSKSSFDDDTTQWGDEVEIENISQDCVLLSLYYRMLKYLVDNKLMLQF